MLLGQNRGSILAYCHICLKMWPVDLFGYGDECRGGLTPSSR